MAIKVMILLSMVGCSLSGPFPIEGVFMLMVFCNILRSSVAVHVPMFVNYMAELNVTVSRAQVQIEQWPVVNTVL